MMSAYTGVIGTLREGGMVESDGGAVMQGITIR